MQPFKILSREILINSPYMPIEKQLVELPNGTTAEWFVNTNKGAVIIIPIKKNGDILLQRTYKHGASEIIIEFCAGMIDHDEPPIKAAQRELREETGYTSTHWTKVGEIFANPTGSTMKYHFFVAEYCHKTDQTQFDDAEQIENFTVANIIEAKKLLLHPKTKTACTAIAALTYAQEFLDQR